MEVPSMVVPLFDVESEGSPTARAFESFSNLGKLSVGNLLGSIAREFPSRRDDFTPCTDLGSAKLACDDRGVGAVVVFRLELTAAIFTSDTDGDAIAHVSLSRSGAT